MSKRKNCFPLIELLVVIGVIAVLAGIAIGVTQVATQKASEAKARAQIEALEIALDRYRDDFGYYPQSGGAEIDITEEFVMGSGSAPRHHGLQDSDATGETDYFLNVDSLRFAGGNCLDPFGMPYKYRYPGTENPGSYDLWSYGADNDPAGGDNITNWRKQ